MPSYDICRPLLSGVVRGCLRLRDVQTVAVLSSICAAADLFTSAPAAVPDDGPGNPNSNPNPNHNPNPNRNPIPNPNPNPNPEQVWKPLLLLAVDRLYSTSTGLGEYAEDPREQCRYLFEALNALPVSALPPVRELP